MKDEPIVAWITAYALTKGILKVNGVVCHSVSGNMIKYGQYETAHGKDWHRTPDAALARAEEMRKDKIASVRKQLTKLENIVFSAD